MSLDFRGFLLSLLLYFVCIRGCPRSKSEKMEPAMKHSMGDFGTGWLL